MKNLHTCFFFYSFLLIILFTSNSLFAQTIKENFWVTNDFAYAVAPSEDGREKLVSMPGTQHSRILQKASAAVDTPVLLLTLKDRWEEAWQGSPAVADIDIDGNQEIIVPRDNALIVWNADGSFRWKFNNTPGRIWASPVVADFRNDSRLEIVFASRDQIFMLDANGNVLSGFPITWEDEIRSLAAGDVDGDGQLDIIATPAHASPTDVVNAWHADGSQMVGFPPNESGTSGCDSYCFIAGCFDQNLAVGYLDGDSTMDIVVPHDNAYASFHKGTGEAFDANIMFQNRKKTPGVRYLHDLALAQQGWPNNEDTDLQAHFTNTAPAIADVDGDGSNEIVILGSVQNASQTDRLKGVALWIVRPDASRITGWEAPLHFPNYLAGLWDLGSNIVAATNQVAIADIDSTKPGPEFIFAGFDGKIHAIATDQSELWSFTYTTDPHVLTGGVVVGDLSSDSIPEIVFNTYSTDTSKGALFILDASGNKLYQLLLPRRGAMPVPTLADVDGNGTVEIVVSLKDAEDMVSSVLVYTIASSSTDCLLWPTGRGNLLRNGCWANPNSTPNSAKVSNEMPLIYQLLQNYPNPFNPTTTIEFTLGKNSRVSLKIFDILGREIITLVNEELKSGVLYKKTFDATNFSSGIYFYRLQAGERTMAKKLLLLK
jgi:hypothetical protein